MARNTFLYLSALLITFHFSSAAISPEECAFKFQMLGFDAADYASYPRYYGNDSVLTLAEAGSYVGPKDIEEYVRFADPSSPYIESETPMYFKIQLSGFDPIAETCTFLATSITRYTLDYRTATPATFEVGLLSKIKFSAKSNKIATLNLYYTKEYLEFVFAEILNTRKSRKSICSTLISNCSEVHEMNYSPSLDKCVDILEEIPVLSPGGMATGLDQGCRHLHAVLAAKNPAHCPHISFIPITDSSGKIKCQKSELASVYDYFSVMEMNIHNQLIAENGMDPELGYKIMCTNSNKWTISLAEDKNCTWIAEDPYTRCGLSGATNACAEACHESCLLEALETMEPEDSPLPMIEEIH